MPGDLAVLQLSRIRNGRVRFGAETVRMVKAEQPKSYAKLVSGDGLKTSDLIGDTPTTVFIQILLASMINTPAVCRTIVGARLNAVIRADGKGRQRKVLFLLNEAARLGRPDVLEAARDVGRKYRHRAAPSLAVGRGRAAARRSSRVFSRRDDDDRRGVNCFRSIRPAKRRKDRSSGPSGWLWVQGQERNA